MTVKLKPPTHTITIDHKSVTGSTVHAVFIHSADGKLERIDARYKKAGCDESVDMYDCGALMSRLLELGEPLQKIAHLLHPSRGLRKCIDEYIAQTRGAK